MNPLIRQHLIFEGTVQNVGFRYELTRLAQHYDCTGWVRNRVDGSVEAQIQGTSHAIQAVLEELNTITHIQITALHRASLPLIPAETRFMTRYD